jgi:hypothetical protein
VVGFVLGRESGKSEGYPVVRVIECVGEHYEVQDAQGDRVYRWCPATVSLECECGQRLTLTSSRTTCFRCGADHMDFIKEVLGVGIEEDEGHSPWRSLRSYLSRPSRSER